MNFVSNGFSDFSFGLLINVEKQCIISSQNQYTGDNKMKEKENGQEKKSVITVPARVSGDITVV